MAKKRVQRSRNLALGYITIIANGKAVHRSINHQRIEYSDGTVEETGTPAGEVIADLADEVFGPPKPKRISAKRKKEAKD